MTGRAPMHALLRIPCIVALMLVIAIKPTISAAPLNVARYFEIFANSRRPIRTRIIKL